MSWYTRRMSDLVIVTYDWVPPPPRGFVRDVRARWALEEAGIPYRVESASFKDRGPEHLAHQPFGQVPWLTEGDISIFESGAMLLYIAEKSERLLPRDPKGRAEVTEWLFAALNSVEMASLPWWLLKISGKNEQVFDNFLKLRLDRLEAVLARREWLTGTFSVADVLMADVLRLVHHHEGLGGYPAVRDYVIRATARPAFVKAHADQVAHFAKADG